MRDKKLFYRSKPFRLTIMLCCLVVYIALAVLLISDKTETISDPDVPLGVIGMITEGDVLTVTISAPEVEDLYSYQFRLAYDNTQFKTGSPQSLLEEMPTIFKKDFDGYTLIGATMTGDSLGYSASGAQLCKIKLTALTDGAIPELSLTKVNVVSSGLDYIEDVEGWTYEMIAD